MRLYDRLVDHARWRAVQYTSRRPPDKVIGKRYLERWYVIPRNRVFNIYLHRYTGSDDERAIHDHPWWSLSWMLAGLLLEIDNDAERYVAGGSCVECQKERERERYRELQRLRREAREGTSNG